MFVNYCFEKLYCKNDISINKTANAAFHQEDTLNGEEGEIALRKYSGVLTEDFMQKVVTIQPVNFLEDSEAATQMINTWANETTRGKISEIFTEPLDPDTLMVLASSLYFKASWNKKFELEKPFKTCWAGSLGSG
jgi:serine protease inhibitor